MCLESQHLAIGQRDLYKLIFKPGRNEMLRSYRIVFLMHGHQTQKKQICVQNRGQKDSTFDSVMVESMTLSKVEWHTICN